MWGVADNREFVRRVCDSLKPGGTIIIRDFIVEKHRTAPRMAVVFALNMLVNTASGSTYSEGEYRDWLKAAGYSEIEIKPLPGPTKPVIGRKQHLTGEEHGCTAKKSGTDNLFQR